MGLCRSHQSGEIQPLPGCLCHCPKQVTPALSSSPGLRVTSLQCFFASGAGAWLEYMTLGLQGRHRDHWKACGLCCPFFPLELLSVSGTAPPRQQDQRRSPRGPKILSSWGKSSFLYTSCVSIGISQLYHTIIPELRDLFVPRHK